MKTLIVIPARYASTRFPGKPLAQLGGKPIIDHVYSKAAALDCQKAVVATDDERIYNHMVATFGKESVMMTSDRHRSGTDRCGEVAETLSKKGEHYDVVINLQGDEPFVDNDQLNTLIKGFENPAVQIATLKTRIHSNEELLSPNNVKVVCSANGQALYFSRLPIPYCRDCEGAADCNNTDYFKHVGIYGFRTSTLAEVCRLPISRLESCEKLEQLRWLEAGYVIAVYETTHSNIGIDTPADLAEAERWLENNISKQKIN